MRSLLLEVLFVTLGVALAVALLAWPVPIAPGRWFVGASWNDAHSIAWTLQFVASRLAEGLPPWGYTDAIEWPVGGVLFPALLPGAVAVAPVTWAAGPVVAYNLLAVGHHGLTAGVTWGWLRREGFAPSGAAVGAIALGFCPALVASTVNGNPDITPWFFLPGALWAVHRPGLRRSVLAAVLVTLAGLSNPYVGVMAGVAVCLRLASLRRWRDLGVATVLIALGAAAVAGAIGAALASPQAAIVKGPRASLVGTSTLLGLLDPRPLMMPTDRVWTLPRVATASYLGLALLLAAPFARRGRAFGWGLVAFGVIAALGPELQLWAEDVLPPGQKGPAEPNPGRTGIAMPWRLAEMLPGLSHLHLTSRYTGLAVLGLAWLAADAVGRLPRLRWGYVALVAVDLLVVAQGAVLLRAAPTWQDESCEVLRDLEPGPVFDLPLTFHELWIFDGICHGNPVAEAINRPMPRDLRGKLEKPALRDRIPLLAQEDYRWLVYHHGIPGDQQRELLRPIAACLHEKRETVEVYDLACVREQFTVTERLPARRAPREEREP